MHPLNKNQLYYPGFAGNGGNNGNGGDGLILPTDFGDWTDLPQKSTQIFDEQIAIQYKLDMANYPTKAILYLVGQFGLKNTFVGSVVLLGILPEDTRPKHQIRQNITVQGTECYLIIETNGNVKLSAVTGDLPVTDGDTENFPYFLNLNYNPDIADAPPVETFTANRSGNFTRNNCGVGYTGSEVEFSKSYTSNVSQQAAENIADANFQNDGQAYANDPAHGTCTITAAPSFSAQRSQSFTRNNCASGELGSAVPFTKNYTGSTQQAADDAAANDADFITEGQAFANDPVNGATCTVIGGNYSAQRTQSFTRSNCGNGQVGSSIPFSKNYTSVVSQIDADNQAANDPDFITEGQAFANDPVNGATCEVIPVEPVYIWGRLVEKNRERTKFGGTIYYWFADYYLETYKGTQNAPPQDLSQPYPLNNTAITVAYNRMDNPNVKVFNVDMGNTSSKLIEVPDSGLPRTLVANDIETITWWCAFYGKAQGEWALVQTI